MSALQLNGRSVRVRAVHYVDFPKPKSGSRPEVVTAEFVFEDGGPLMSACLYDGYVGRADMTELGSSFVMSPAELAEMRSFAVGMVPS